MCNLFTFMLKPKEKEALSIIRSFFRENWSIPSVRSLQGDLWYASTRSVQLIIDSLVDKGYLVRHDGKISLWVVEDHQNENTINVPLVWMVACWLPMLAEENIEAQIPVSTKIAYGTNKYFFLRAKGDSMNNEGINDGDLILVRSADSATEWQIVVALIDDEATIKRIHYDIDYISLNPCSTNEKHKPIILHEDFRIQWIFVRSFPSSTF